MKQNYRYTHNEYLKTRLFTHLDTLFDNYSKILMLRIDLAYRKDSESFNLQDENEMAWQMTLLTEQLTLHTDIIGFVWVMECSALHGVHIHSAFYLDGQHHRKVWNAWQTINSLWEDITAGEGYTHRCKPQSHYRVRGEWVITHDDEKGRRGMSYILSYLSKQEQKEDELIYRVSDIPERHRKGRPRRKSMSENTGW
ncbi:inovirus Gp2 family protein [Citrobacter sp. wls617]|uniref:YagK/YfjJ domain-containing protein n=1 Tax=Citrobacter sp. wls617 TaxID=2576434 RepID=UPI0010CA14C8|nr:inovirus-type Gp2 protein [Citrobacter sp. wls617]TKU94871.1 inovirus Gp2 family protein [Citrobacter sp. wls617]